MIRFFSGIRLKKIFMKILKMQFGCLMLFVPLVFTSCIKRDNWFNPNNSPSYQPIVAIDTLAGKEFQFDSLIWSYDDNTDNAYLLITNRPDLFTHPRNFEISLRREGSFEWEPVVRRNTIPPSGRLVYSVGMGNLYIFPSPADFSLDGKSASVKIRF